MGLFGGGNKKTYTTTNLTDERQSTALSNLSGPAVVTKGNVALNLSYTDQGAIQSSLALANKATEKALDHGSTVAKSAFTFGNNALSLSDRATKRALLFGDTQADRAFTFAKDVQRQANESQRDSVASVVDTSNKALAAVDAANRSDTARNLETLIKWGGIAGAALAVAWIMRGQ